MTGYAAAINTPGVALVLVDPGEGSVFDAYVVGQRAHAMTLEWQRRANARRQSLTLEVCFLVANAMINTADMMAERAHAGASEAHRRAAVADSFPGYVMIRNYVAFELGVNYTTACEVAFDCAARHAAFEHRREFTFAFGRERGWL